MTEFWRWNAAETARRIKTREVSAAEVTRSALERLDAVNPAVNAVVAQMPEDAMNAAFAVDARIAAGEEPGLLAGVPVTVKESVDQAGFATTNGLKLQGNLVAEQDNPVVSNLRKAGAVIVGRTNTPAFSLRWFTRNLLHGETFNPHNRDLTPGGSSGGAAAATASGIGAIGHGTDIGGSIRYPAYACGIHGLRPSPGRIPAVNFTAPDRHIGAQLMAVSGPLARTVEDVRLGFEAMAAGDHLDPWWTPVPVELPQLAKRAALCLRPSDMPVSEDVEAALKDAAKRLENAGWEVEEVSCPDMREAARLQLVLWMAEFKRGAAVLIENEADPDALFVYEQLSRQIYDVGLNELMDALQHRVTLMRQWKIFFEDYSVLLCPNSGEPPFPNHLDVDSMQSFDRVFEAQLPQIAPPAVGLPGLSVATGIGKNNVPMGVQLLAGPYREDVLFSAGRDIEAAGPEFPPVDPAASL